MDFGLPTLIEHENLKAAADLCGRLGFQFVEINMNFPMYQLLLLEKTDELNALAGKYRIYFTIHLDENLNVCDFNPLVAEAYLETVERAIRAAGEIGAPLLNMHMNHGIYVTLPDRKAALYERYKEEYLSSIRRFRERCGQAAEEVGTKICIENTDGFREYEREAIDLLLQSDAFALTWDIGHSHACGNADEPFLMERRDRLCHFHIHDGLGGKNHQTLGTGEIDLAHRLGVAESCSGRCVVETKTVEALEQSAAWLRERGYL